MKSIKNENLQHKINIAQNKKDIFETLIDLTPDLIFLEDLDCNILFTNKSFNDTLGYSTNEIGTLNNFKLVKQSDLHNFKIALKKVIDGNTYKNLEYRIRTKKGEYICLSSNLTPYFENNEIVGILSISRNITESKKSQLKLENRARQQAVVAEFGQHALIEKDLDVLFKEAVEILAEYLNVDYSKILELTPDHKHFLLKAGVGWEEGLIGKALIETDKKSQAGFTLMTTKPVIVKNLKTETRFQGPPLLIDHNIISGMSVIIRGKDKDNPYGILGAHSKRYCEFSEDDINFLQAVANILASAIVQHKADIELKESEEKFKNAYNKCNDGLKEKVILLKEIHHRVKNNLQIISSLIILQLKSISDEQLKDILIDFQNRIKSIALIHEILYQTENFNCIKISDYLQKFIKTLFQTYKTNSNNINLNIEVEDIDFDLTKAINCGLIINELVTNALKYAFRDEKREGILSINIKNYSNADIILEIQDNGVGGITKEDFYNSKTLGFRLVNTLVKQLEGEIAVNPDHLEGTHFRILIPK